MTYLHWYRFRRMNRLAIATTCAALALVATACGQARPPAQAGPVTQPAIPIQLTVEVYADRLDPEQLVLDAGTTWRVELFNRSGEPCTFYIGPYLSDLEVPSNGQAEMGFTVPSLPGTPDAPHTTTTFGCRGDEAPTGNVVVMPRPSR